MLVPCEHCGKLVNRMPSKVRTQKHIFCSNACHGYARENPRGYKHPNHTRAKKRVTDMGYLPGMHSSYRFKSLSAHQEVVLRNILRYTIPARRGAFLWVDGRAFIANGWVVHHVDEDKCNNEVSNLMVLTRAEHINIHRRTLIEGQHKSMKKGEKGQ